MWITPRACSSPIRRKRRKPPCAPMRLRFPSCRRSSAARAAKRSLSLPASTCAIWRPCSLPAILGRRHDAPSACLPKPACWPATTCTGRPSLPPRRGRASSHLWKPAPGSSQAERWRWTRLAGLERPRRGWPLRHRFCSYALEERLSRGQLRRWHGIFNGHTIKKAPAENRCKGFLVVWSQLRDLNSRPADYESAALPTELSWQNLLKKLLAERQPPVNLQDATSCRSSWNSCLPERR